MKILPVGDELFHADGTIDMTKLKVTFRNFFSNRLKTMTVVISTYFTSFVQ